MTATPTKRISVAADAEPAGESGQHDEFEQRGGVDSAWSLVVAGDAVDQGQLADDPVGDAVAERVSSADLALVNLEGPRAVDGASVDKTGPQKRLDPEFPARLADAGFDAATLANNHIMDFGPAGLATTTDACRSAGLATVGAGQNIEAALEPLVYDLDERTVAVFNVCEREFGVADETTAGTAWESHPSVERRIACASADHDAVVVVAHGGIEYTPLPPTRRQAKLRGFVDAGADAVVGHHPHVPQGWELYRETPILYSLGNFLFTHANRTKTNWGLLPTLHFDVDGVVAVDLLLTEFDDGRVGAMRERSPEETFAYLDRLSTLTADDEALRAHWQELAIRLFAQRYTGWLRRATGAGLQQLLRNPRAALGDTAWDPDDRQSELLTLLNLVRNESHRAVIETTLSVKTGDSKDLRTPEVREEVRDLLAWTEDEPVYDRPSSARRAVRAVVGRLSD